MTEYVCLACGFVWDGTEDTPPVCPACGESESVAIFDEQED